MKMNTFKLALLTSALVAGLAQAAPSCDGFEIKLQNKLSDDLIIRKINLNGAHIQPGALSKLNKGAEETFTINDSHDKVAMEGEFILNTISLPSREVIIKFNLKNQGPICEHTDHSPDSKLSLQKTRLPGKVHYAINNK